MITEIMPNLKIHRLTQEQYDLELAAGTIDENAIYLTPAGGSNGIPAYSMEDSGKFLQVVDGVATWVSIPRAEGVSF